MYPFAFAETESIRRTRAVLTDQPAVTAVVYATGTVGLEALLAGLPTLRFRPRGRIAIDILPEGVAAVAVDADTLDAALDRPVPPGPLVRESVITPIDLAVWRRYLMAA